MSWSCLLKMEISRLAAYQQQSIGSCGATCGYKTSWNFLFSSTVSVMSQCNQNSCVVNIELSTTKAFLLDIPRKISTSLFLLLFQLSRQSHINSWRCVVSEQTRNRYRFTLCYFRLQLSRAHRSPSVSYQQPFEVSSSASSRWRNKEWKVLQGSNNLSQTIKLWELFPVAQSHFAVGQTSDRIKFVRFGSSHYSLSNHRIHVQLISHPISIFGCGDKSSHHECSMEQ